MRLVGHVARMGGRGEVYTGFWGGNLRERDHLEDPGVDRRIILNGCSGSGMWGHRLVRSGSRDSWRALVNAVINLRVP
jgi:hypothetical protein